MKRFAALAGAAACAACNLAPDYHRPEMPAVTAYKEAAPDDALWHPAVPADDRPRGEWWRVFGDPVLDQLEARASESNESLKAAVARYDQARASARYARAQYFPVLGLDGGGNRQRLSQAIANPRPKSLYNDFSLEGDVSYEVDVWGRVRNSVGAAGDRAEASAADLASMALSIHAELATDYFSLRGDDTQQAILDQTVADYDRALKLAVDRLAGGAGVVADVAQAQTQLETARTRASDMRLKRAQLEHAIAILVGAAPASFGLPPAPLDAAPPPVGVTLPAELLERRPDIAAAERRVAAANADIGVARAAYFPNFALNGSGGVESAMLGTLFSGPATLWSLGPSLTLSIFDGGQIDADVARSRAAYEEMAADYRGTVLGAYREVEDNLAALARLNQEDASQTAAAAAAGRALDQARYRFNGGIVTYLEVVTTENSVLQARLDQADIATRRMNAAVTLVKAMGGGWKQG
jgi:NodT family efflux transporter outer membrane factor (OMF) lipoprotein